MKSKLEKAIMDGNIVIPLYILKHFKKLNLTMEEFIFLMYLYNKQDKIDFNPEKIASDMNIDIMEVMGYISILTDKGYLTLDVINENNILEEKINLSLFYDKISILLIEEDEIKNNKIDLLKYIEEEFGKSLNANEKELVNSWIQNKIDDDLIKEAVKIAINDGVFSLKYVDRMLFDFKNRGIMNINDIKNNKPNDNKESIEIEDWNWLDDEEEYITN